MWPLRQDYREIQQVAEKAPEHQSNWIDKYYIIHGELPVTPDWLAKLVPGLTEGEKIEPKPARTPHFNDMPPPQEKEFKDYCDWAIRNAIPGQPVCRPYEEIKWHWRRMLPKTPRGADNIRYTPRRQR